MNRGKALISRRDATTAFLFQFKEKSTDNICGDMLYTKLIYLLAQTFSHEWKKQDQDLLGDVVDYVE